MASHPSRSGARAPVLVILLAGLLALPFTSCNCGEVVLPWEEDVGGSPGDLDATATVDSGEGVDSGEALPDGGEGEDAGEGVDAGEPADAAEGDVGTACPEIDCTGKCGPVRDFCSGNVKQCPACAAGLVCTLDTHQCVVPAITCAQLGAECGLIRNTCGERLNCGACSDVSKECDRNSHKCVPCSGPTCEDLGYQCGMQWLGCGPTSHKTDCGTCPSGSTCNAGLCETSCTPRPTAEICEDAKAECGYISNGCGGQVDCGACPAGKACGARGIGNRCDPPEFPDECLAAARECGTMTSACGGKTLDCGKCTEPEICWPDGHCAVPCVPKTCEKDYAGQCGEDLPEGCTPGLTLDCRCTGADVCTTTTPGATGTCITPSGCDKFGANGQAGQPCSNDPSAEFPKGDGTNLACPCAGAAQCVKDGALVGTGESGTCCLNTIACALNACDVTVKNACTGADIPCTCTTAGTHCNPDTDLCETNHTCAYFSATGKAGEACSIGSSVDFPKGDGTNLSCPCNSGGRCNKPGTTQLADPNGRKGECCFNTVACAADECNTTKVNPCTGATITCACTAAGQHCNNTTNKCEVDNGCSKFTSGQAGQPCSNGASPAFPKGDGTNLTCPCSAQGAQCFSGSAPLPNGSPTQGTCCVPDTCQANSCATITDHCSGQQIACACTTPGTHCNTTTHQCEANLDCAAYSANGAIGDVCSNGPSFSNGGTPPTLLTCACTGSNVVCSNGTSVVTGTGCGTAANPCPQGTCCQNTVTCGANPNRRCNVTLKNSCTGADINCGCDANYYCDAPADGICRPYLTCNNHAPPANGAEGAPCSTSNNPEFPRWPVPPGNCSTAGCPADTTGRTCNCGGGRFCSVAGSPPHLAGPGEVGACCTNTTSCGANPNRRCNVTLKNSCTNVDINCGCDANYYCDAASDGICRPYAVCSAFTNGDPGSVCSNGNDATDFPRYPGDTQGLTCRCDAGNCYKNNAVVSGATGGTCCTPPSIPAGNVGDPCTPVHDPCTNTDLPRNCRSGNYCKAGVCAAFETCATLGANGAAGQTCSNGNAFDRGDGTLITCPCSGSGLCLAGTTPVSGANKGTCCVNTAVCPANTCAPLTNTCTGATINCSCSAGNHCNGSGASATCSVDKTCADYNATGAVGKPCSAGATSAFPDGPGDQNLTCNCSAASPYTNNACVGWNATTAGTCTCVPTAPANCGDNGKPNGCGGTMVSTCTPTTQVCYQNACCTKPVCPAGNAGDTCGALSACGISLNCACTQQYQTCGAVTAGKCGCKPKTEADCIAPGNMPDGCGGIVVCPG